MKRQLTLSLCIAAMAAPAAFAGATPLDTVRVIAGLSRPVWATWAPNDRDRMFVLEQWVGNQGRIRIVNMTTNPPTLVATPYLSITVSTGNEQGLLCLAFHPDFESNRKFYISYNAPSGGASWIDEYQQDAVNPNIADVSTRRAIFTQSQPFTNHNGGWIAFGPDGYLYAAFGDGGSANDPGNRAQNLNVLLGKMLRLDVNGDDFPADSLHNYAIPPTNPFAGAAAGLDQIWAYGLRNPWRNSFDRETGDLWYGDVGQNAWEEIDFEPANTGGRNYGWRCMEGNSCTGLSGCTCNDDALTDPVHVYGHGQGCSVTGGYVYRGNAICDLQGTYFFADYCSNQIWSFVYNGSVTQFTNRTAELAPGGGLSINSITSFAEDLDGELYIVDQGGEIYKIIAGAPGAECAGLPGDMNCDGVVTVADIAGFVLALTDPAGYASTYPDCDINNADINNDETITVSDIGPFVTLLTGG